MVELEQQPAAARPSLAHAEESDMNRTKADGGDDLYAANRCDSAPVNVRCHAADVAPAYFDCESGRLSEGYRLGRMGRDSRGTDHGWSL